MTQKPKKPKKPQKPQKPQKPRKIHANYADGGVPSVSLITEKSLERARQIPDKILGEDKEEREENRQKLALALHCIACARQDIGQESLAHEQLLKWLFSFVDQIPQDIWCRLAEAFYALGLIMVQENTYDKVLRNFCDSLYKPIHEYQQSRRFLQEEFVREKFRLSSSALMLSAGFQKNMMPIHLRHEAERAAP
jgi:hypothetical protein